MVNAKSQYFNERMSSFDSHLYASKMPTTYGRTLLASEKSAEKRGRIDYIKFTCN